jgi:hypothetical protein
MRWLVVLVSGALIALAVTVAPALAGNLKKYDGASWYAKYLAVSGQPAPSVVTPLCTGDTGVVAQPDFGTNVDASHECGSQSETSIAINPNDPMNVIAGSNEIQSLPMDSFFSSDGGATFTRVPLPLPPARTNNGFDFGSDPGVAFDLSGVAYYSYIVVFFSKGGAINGTELAVAHSTDGGATWSAVYFDPQTGEGQFDDKPMITVDTSSSSPHQGRVYVAWDNATGNSSSEKNGNNVLLSHSDDGGNSFSPPVSVSGNFVGRTGAIGADPYVTPNGTVHVAWQDNVHLTIDDVSSTDGGNSFSSPHPVASVNAVQLNVAAQAVRGALVYPACGAASDDTLYCSYINGTDAASSVFVAKSTDGGSTWSSTQMPGNGDQFNQWLAVDPTDGSVNVAYYDTGTHGAVPTLYTVARSTDGGLSYSAVAVATEPTDESQGAGVDLGNQYGDYEGIAAFDGIVRPVWTDRRQAVIDLGLREEVFTATLTP